ALVLCFRSGAFSAGGLILRSLGAGECAFLLIIFFFYVWVIVAVTCVLSLGSQLRAVLAITLCVLGVTMLFVLLNLFFTTAGQLQSTDIPMLMVGYGFGASFVGMSVACFLRKTGCLKCLQSVCS